MAFEDIKENAEELKNHARELYESNVRYYKLLVFKTLVQSTTSIMRGVLLTLMVVFILLFLSTALALALGYWLDNFAWGFLIVGVFYIIVSFIIYKMAPKMIEGSLMGRFSRFFFKNDKNE
jgi:Zn-dependent protease with chaperone function